MRRALLLAILFPHLALATGRIETINGYRVLTVSGRPDELGREHGRLLGEQVRRVVQDVVVDGAGAYDLDGLLNGAMVMERYLEPDFRTELHALADAAGVDYRQLVALQLFGDVRIAPSCTGFAAFGPATATGECIVGRNMDYWDYGVGEFANQLCCVQPDVGHDFVTVSWAGVINGWTALNEHGIFCSNNIGYGPTEGSLEGLSTCFMVRKVVQYAATVDEAVAIVRRTPRAIGTILLIAGGDPADAVVVEYDHAQVCVRRAEDGWVAADNTMLLLGNEDGQPDPPSEWSRCGRLQELYEAARGQIDRTMNFAAADGVPIRSINLHSALAFPADRSLYVSLGPAPAADQPYRGFRLTPAGIIGLDVRPATAAPESDPQRSNEMGDCEMGY